MKTLLAFPLAFLAVVGIGCDDGYEREADTVAERLMDSPVQRRLDEE
jgi:hypothetical protein